jgi:hypothetical protein
MYNLLHILSSLVTDLNEMEIKIKSRLAVGNKSYHALGPILKKKRSISQLITNSDIWSRGMGTLTIKWKKMLMTWERKILRKMYGPTYEN